MRWAIYVRVSTQGQEDNGIGLDVQEADCRAFLAERGLGAGAVFSDVCSGAMLDREAMADLLVAARDGQYAGVVFKRLDRLARDTLVQEVLLQEMAKAKLVVRSCSAAENAMLDDPESDPDPMRKFTRVILSAASELERKLIAARTQAAKRMLRGQGKHVDGPVPAGMVKDPDTKRLSYLPELVPHVRDALRMRDHGATLEAIGEFWFSTGWTTGRVDGTWSATAVARHLRYARELLQPSEFLSAQAGLFTPGGRQ